MDEHRKLTKQLKSYKNWGWTAALLAAGGAVALIVCGVVIVKPIIETNSLEFKETTCTTTRGYLTGQWISCSCGDKCTSRFPCLRMTVTYVPTNTNNASSVDAVLFDTEQRLNSDGDYAEEYQCVTAPCDRGVNDNRVSVLNFNDTYAPGKSYSCLYHPGATTQVLLKRLFTWNDMFHSMLWSGIAFVIFGCITLYIMAQCYKIRKRMSSIPVPPPPAVPVAQPGHFLPPQLAGFLPPPPGYPGVQSGESLQMQPAPQRQDLYNTNYSNLSTDNKGFTYS
ncbi:KCNMB2 [Branchiostoma lanceolatum]|uniref:KCNMB2 protein n=1 Tax=Branchiostoma lanceolatum TaxID=7740 RepID=A0A8J9WGR9_BRALA|nr:KCNMB2 [Branchiostoma lanceolatum]